ncbi:MAG: hypothetical protein JSS09_08535, partial [Verrucomicrobia bacterium]|nr:hypothetical protein [Verrucomicrobiota bacterium]
MAFFRVYQIAFVIFVFNGFVYCEQKNNLPQIVAFLGSNRVGKDTSADFLIKTYGYQKYALADPMKKAVQSLFHFSDQQLWGDEKEIIDPYWQVTPREVMQFIGIDTLFEGLGTRFPHLGHTFYLRAFERFRKEHPQSLIVISDLRMQEDVNALKEMGAFIIRIERPGLVSKDNHASELQVPLVKGVDFTIVNDSTIEELENKIVKV